MEDSILHRLKRAGKHTAFKHTVLILTLKVSDNWLGKAQFDALQEREEAVATQSQAAEELKTLPDVEALRAESARLRAALSERRAELVEARTEHDRLVREAEAVGARCDAVRAAVEAGAGATALSAPRTRDRGPREPR